jgi:PAS domain S-box-containing protein
MKNRIFLTILYIAFQSLSIFGQSYLFKNMTTDDGLSSNVCNFAKVDNYGYVWIGHPKGAITRYDGVFDNARIRNSEVYNINCMDFDKNGVTWYGSDEMGLSVWYQRKWYYYQTDYGFNNNTITKGIFRDDKNSQLILAIKDTIRIYTVTEGYILSKSYKSIPATGLLKLDKLTEERAIVYTSRGVFSFENEQLKLWPIKFTNEQVIDLDIISSKRIIVTTEKNVFDASYNTENIFDGKQLPFSSKFRFVESAFENNKLYVASYDEGLFQFDFNKRTTQLYNKRNGLLNYKLVSVAADKEGYVYLCTEEDGLIILGLCYVQNFKDIDLLNSRNIKALQVTNAGAVWIGDKFGQIAKYENSINTRYSIKGAAINAIVSYQNQVYAATNLGVYVLKGNDFEKDTRFIGSNCSQLFVDSKDRLWLTFAENTGIYLLQNNQVKIYETGKLGLPLDIQIIKIRQHNNGNIYFALEHDLIVFDENKFKQIGNQFLGNLVLNDFDFDKTGDLWLACMSGLFYRQSNKLNKVEHINNYRPKNVPIYIASVSCDKLTNKVYANTAEGLNEIQLVNGKIADKINIYALEEGVLKLDAIERLSLLDAKGNFYFATNGGLHLLNSDHETLINYSYEPFLSYITVNYNDTNLFKRERFYVNRSDKKHRFEFEYDEGTFTLNFRELSKKWSSGKYGKTKMTPDESEWIDRDGLSYDYNFLSPGLHTFTFVPNMRHLGKDGEPITVELYFKGKWYQSNWFFVAIFCLIAIGFAFILRSFRSYDSDRVYKYNLASETSNAKSNLLVVIVGAVFLPSSALVFNVFVPNVDNLIWPSWMIGIALGVYYLMAVIKPQLSKYSQNIIVASLYIFSCFILFLNYYTKLHPYYFIGLLLIVFASVSILKYIKEIVIYMVIFCVGALLVYFTVSTTTYSYDKNLFIIGILFTAIILIMNLVIKLNVQEKLYFSNDIVNNGSSLVMSGDDKGNITFVSDNFESILGYKKEEVMGQAWWAITARSNEDASKNKAFVLTEVKENEPYVRPIRTKSGEFKYIQWVDKNISSKLIVSVGQDVTDKKELEDKYQFLLQNADDGFFQTDKNGLFVFSTKKIDDLMGLSHNQIIGKFYHDLVREDNVKKVILHYMRQLKNNVLASYVEFPLRRQDNKEIWVGQTAKMIFNDDNEFMGFIAVTRDITDKRKMEEVMFQKNKDINDNLNYAKRMQDALLPSHTNLQLYLKNIFLVSKPRDVVSGDFSFIERVGNKLVIAIGDCTGHGFTGAFMTVLGTNILRTLTSKKKELSPEIILKELDAQIDASLNSQYNENEYVMRDGMEIGVCVFDFNTKIMEYAGAGLSLFYIQDNDLLEIQGDFKQIGNLDISDFQYNKKTIEYTKDTNFYMFSDGFQDQFGGPDKKKFSRKRTKQVLLDLQDKNFNEQKIAVETVFDNWKGSIRQTDDFIFLGFNLKV